MGETEFARGVNGANGVHDEVVSALRPRVGSRSLPYMSNLLGNSLNDRLLFAVPKSKCPLPYLKVAMS